MFRHAGLSTRSAHVGNLYFVALLQEELGRRIRLARNHAGLTQDQLAKAIGLKHAQDVSRYERGITDVPAFRIDRIAEATNRPRSWFTRDPSEPDAAPSGDGDGAALDLNGLRQQVEDLSEKVDRQTAIALRILKLLEG